jgi:4-hydroxy-tetrahydrodipicolinate synthase
LSAADYNLRVSVPPAAAPLGRILTAMVTPFAADGSLDLGASRALARHLVAHGSEGLVLAGTTGEAPTLSDSEKLALFEAVLDEVGGDVHVVANTGTYDTAHSAALTRQAGALGVHGFLAVTPYYSKPPLEGVRRHFGAIAESAGDLPLVLYNIPQRVIVNVDPASIIQIAAAHANLVAVKQATPDPAQARAIIEAGIAVYAGNDDLVLPFLEIGGCGGICVASHLVGPRFIELCDLVAAGRLDEARARDAELVPLLDVLAVTVNPIPIKTALDLLGHRVGGLRLPLVEASAAERIAIQAALAAFGLTAHADATAAR